MDRAGWVLGVELKTGQSHKAAVRDLVNMTTPDVSMVRVSTIMYN